MASVDKIDTFNRKYIKKRKFYLVYFIPNFKNDEAFIKGKKMPTLFTFDDN